AAPAQPTVSDSIVVTARVDQAFSPVANVTLNWRVMFGVTNQLQMLDDGLHGDGAANDHVYGAVIPAGSATEGQMVRWFITAIDSTNRTSRWPLFDNPIATAEYLGTVIAAPGVTSQLPIWQTFVALNQTAGIDSETGGRISLFYDGEFYDNIYMELRGNTTASYPKKSHRMEFNAEHPFRHSPDFPRLRKTSLLS